MRNQKLNDERHSTRLDGAAIVYRTRQSRLDVSPADFAVDMGSTTDPKKFRAFLLKRTKSGKRPPKIAKNTLHRDIILISGAGASANFVVSWLYHMINDVKKRGLIVGVKANGEFVRERFDPDKKIGKRPERRKGRFIYQI